MKETQNIADAHNTVQMLSSWLRQAVHEREQAIDGLLLGLMGNQPVCLVGPPGTGKSMLISMLADRMGYSNTFKYLITKYTDQSELFGQFKLSALKKDKLERRTDNTMVDADFVFLDEVFKANSALLNALLTALNERQADIGTGRVDMPYKLICGASNEVPEEEGLEALWDRWVIRVYIDDKLADDSWEKMLFGKTETWADWVHSAIEKPEALQQAFDVLRAMEVVWGDSAKSALVDARGHIAEAGHSLSPRKWKQVCALTESAARLRGKPTVQRVDVATAIQYVWPNVDQREAYLAISENIVAGEFAETYEFIKQFVACCQDTQSTCHALERVVSVLEEVDHRLHAYLCLLLFRKAQQRFLELFEALRNTDNPSHTAEAHRQVMELSVGLKEAVIQTDIGCSPKEDDQMEATWDEVNETIDACRSLFTRFQTTLAQKGGF